MAKGLTQDDVVLQPSSGDTFDAEDALREDHPVAAAAVAEALAQEEATPPEPLIPFEATLYFKSGLQITVEVTSINITSMPVHGIVTAVWTQDSAEPGDDLLQHVTWSEVQLVTTRSLDGPPRKRRR